MDKPTIGRQVRTQFEGEECTATICHVWENDEEKVNLVVMTHSGEVKPSRSVQLKPPVAGKEQQNNTWWWPTR